MRERRGELERKIWPDIVFETGHGFVCEDE